MSTPSPRLPQASLSLFLIGIAFVAVAYVQAAFIPRQAHDDFSRLVQSYGGSMSHSATYPETYRALSAQRRMLQNAYLGVGGLVLTTLGGVALLREAGSYERALRP